MHKLSQLKKKQNILWYQFYLDLPNLKVWSSLQKKNGALPFLNLHNLLQVHQSIPETEIEIIRERSVAIENINV